MTNKKKSLQKFTETEAKFKALMDLKVISSEDLKILNPAEKDQFYKFLLEKSQGLKGEASEAFWNKVYQIIGQGTKNQLWEYNHNQIVNAIATFINTYGRMPTVTEIADKSELSRPTIHKHMKEYKTAPLYLEQIEQFKFMSAKVLARVYSFAVNGDVAAAKLYFNVVGSFIEAKEQGKVINVVAAFGNKSSNTTIENQNNTLIENQNNFIQINNTVLSQDIIKQLNSDQLQQIEAIIKQPK